MGITRPETLVQEALTPEKMAEAQHTAMGTRTRSPCPALALQNAPQTDAIHEDRARAFQKEKTSCQGKPMKAHALPCLKPLIIWAPCRAALTHDNMTRCAAAATLMDHATACRCCHTTAATLPLPHYLAPPLRAACTLMTPHCCCPAAATLLSSPPTLQPTETRLEYNQARNLQLSVTATTPHLPPPSPPLSTSPQTPSPPPLSPRQPAYLLPDLMPYLIYATTLSIPHVFPVSRLYLGEYLA